MENARKRRVGIVAIRRDSRQLKREIDESAEHGLGAAWLSVGWEAKELALALGHDGTAR